MGLQVEVVISLQHPPVLILLLRRALPLLQVGHLTYMAIEETPRIHGWLVGLDLAEGVDPNAISLRLADVVSPLGKASVEYLGTIELSTITEEPLHEA